MSEIRIEFTNEPIEIYIETAKQSLIDESIVLVEARQIDRGNSAAIVLGWDEFLSACKSLKPSAVFCFKEYGLISENIEWAISDVSRDPVEHEELKQSFLTKEAEILLKAMEVCPKYFRCQFYFLSGSAVVVTGIQSSSYLSLINALNEFEEDVSRSRVSPLHNED